MVREIKFPRPQFGRVDEEAPALLAFAQRLVGQFARGHIARHRKQARRLAVRIQNGRNRHIPPLGRRVDKTDEVSRPSRNRQPNRRLRRQPIISRPKIKPRLVQKRLDIFDVQQFLPVLHRKQIACQVEHFDAIWATFDDAATERFALAQPLLRLLALGNFHHYAMHA